MNEVSDPCCNIYFKENSTYMIVFIHFISSHVSCIWLQQSVSDRCNVGQEYKGAFPGVTLWEIHYDSLFYFEGEIIKKVVRDTVNVPSAICLELWRPLGCKPYLAVAKVRIRESVSRMFKVFITVLLLHDALAFLKQCHLTHFSFLIICPML